MSIQCKARTITGLPVTFLFADQGDALKAGHWSTIMFGEGFLVVSHVSKTGGSMNVSDRLRADLDALVNAGIERSSLRHLDAYHGWESFEGAGRPSAPPPVVPVVPPVEPMSITILWQPARNRSGTGLMIERNYQLDRFPADEDGAHDTAFVDCATLAAKPLSIFDVICGAVRSAKRAATIIVANAEGRLHPQHCTVQ